MRALLLAAGEGQRLRPYTLETPKPMLALAGRPILEHNVRLLAAAGIRDLFINTHYRASSVEGYFGDGSAFGVNVTYLREPVLRGTAGALAPLRGDLHETFAVVFGDNLTTLDLPAMLQFHRERRADVSIALFARENATASGVVEVSEDGRVVRFVEKPKPGEVFSSWVNAGYLICEPALLEFVPDTIPWDFGRDVFPAMLGAGRAVCGYRMGEGEHLWWIDSCAEYEQMLALFAGQDNASTSRLM
jgi:NDP-sugar pyrophosphorylase family protein